MPADPRSFFAFASRHATLLEALFASDEGYTESELLALIARRGGDDGAAPDYVLGQLRQLGCVEERPGKTAVLELTQPVRVFLEFLLQSHRLTTPEVVRTYLDEVEALTPALVDAVRRRHVSALLRVLSKLDVALERVRAYARETYGGVRERALRLRSNLDTLPLDARWEELMDLMRYYVQPLEEVIKPGSVADRVLDQLALQLEAAARAVEAGEEAAVLAITRARLVRMRRDVVRDFQESLSEVLPLLEALRRESRLVHGASRLLQRVEREGVRAVGLRERLALPVHRTEGVFADAALEAYVRGLRTYDEADAAAVLAEAPAAAVPHVAPSEALAALRAAVPVPDVLGWLLQRYPDLPVRDVLRLYAHALAAPALAVAPTGAHQTWSRGPLALTAPVLHAF